jgi:hypothetical protein
MKLIQSLCHAQAIILQFSAFVAFLSNQNLLISEQFNQYSNNTIPVNAW